MVNEDVDKRFLIEPPREPVERFQEVDRVRREPGAGTSGLRWEVVHRVISSRAA